jgi:D-arabinose 1-dehydrogenase-like Zn-dependent alcohol dehydrogenase
VSEETTMPAYQLVAWQQEPVLRDVPVADAGLPAPDATAVVTVVGGLGHLAVQVLRVLTAARVVALDVCEDKLAQARELGRPSSSRYSHSG